ncbi:hypothetical protein Tco_0754896 [Tanacetum coccineum]
MVLEEEGRLEVVRGVEGGSDSWKCRVPVSDKVWGMEGKKYVGRKVKVDQEEKKRGARICQWAFINLGGAATRVVPGDTAVWCERLNLYPKTSICLLLLWEPMRWCEVRLVRGRVEVRGGTRNSSHGSLKHIRERDPTLDTGQHLSGPRGARNGLEGGVVGGRSPHMPPMPGTMLWPPGEGDGGIAFNESYDHICDIE